MAQDKEKFIARLPEGMRDRLKAVAAHNNRSMNAELIEALEAHIRNEEYNVANNAAWEGWVSDPEFDASSFPEISDSRMPATKGDIQRVLAAVEAAISSALSGAK